MMAITTDTVLQKMKRELTQAEQTTADETVMKKHIANIQLLCELLLEDQSDSPSESGYNITASEMRAMMGDRSVERSPKRVSHTNDHEGANGDSIFDF